MSKTVHYRGKLIYQERNSPTDTLEEQCKRILENSKEEYYDTFVEALLDTRHKEYVVHNGKLYKIVDFVDTPENVDIFRSRKINGTDYEFEVKYYNGGCGFEEAIDYALEGK